MNEHSLHASKLEIPSTSSFPKAHSIAIWCHFYTTKKTYTETSPGVASTRPPGRISLMRWPPPSGSMSWRTNVGPTHFVKVSFILLMFSESSRGLLYYPILFFSFFFSLRVWTKPLFRVLDTICRKKMLCWLPNAFKVQSSFRISEKHQVYWCIPGTDTSKFEKGREDLRFSTHEVLRCRNSMMLASYKLHEQLVDWSCRMRGFRRCSKRLILRFPCKEYTWHWGCSPNSWRFIQYSGTIHNSWRFIE